MLAGAASEEERFIPASLHRYSDLRGQRWHAADGTDVHVEDVCAATESRCREVKPTALLSAWVHILGPLKWQLEWNNCAFTGFFLLSADQSNNVSKNP